LPPLRGGRRIPPHGAGRGRCRLMAHGDVFRPSRAGRECNPHFLSWKENAPCMVEKKATARPGQGFGRDPSAGVRNGSWACAALPCKGSNKQRQSGFDRAVTDCLCFLFAAAVRCGAEAFYVGFTYPPLRPPDCGSKMTAGTIGDGFERMQFCNSRGRDF
jgi:hypothetical protein